LHCHFVCSSTGHWRLAFFLIGGSSRLLPLFLRVGSAMKVVLQYCRRSVKFLNYWFTDTCTRTGKVSWRIVNTAFLRAGRLSRILFFCFEVNWGWVSIYTDFSKAFDKMCHLLLLDKMSTDVEPSRCQWLGSYLSGRIQRVRMGDCVSRDILVTSGVHYNYFWTNVFESLGFIFNSV
jgi:hypothetical protein